MKRLGWLGLLGDRPLTRDAKDPLDWLNVLSLDRLGMQPGDRDMVVMHHEFVSSFPGGKAERTTATLIDYGIPNGDTSIARTVALPCGIAVRHLLIGTLQRTGVAIPVEADLYGPILSELEGVGIRFEEQTTS